MMTRKTTKIFIRIMKDVTEECEVNKGVYYWNFVLWTAFTYINK